MITELNIDKDQLKSLLEDKYGLRIKTLVFEPKGEVSWSYIVECSSGEKRFLKIHKRKNLNVKRLQLLFDLHAKCEVENIAYPLKTLDGNLEVEVISYPAVLFNFIEGKTSLEQELNSEQLESLGELLAKIHYSKNTIGSFDVKENFTHTFKPGIQKIYDNLETLSNINEYALETKKIYQDYKEIFFIELNSLEHLANELRNKNLDFVNCHGEPSPNNIMISPDDQVYLIDWDEPIFAPKEKDLMFFDKRLEEVLKGYGKVSNDIKLNKDVLKYYQLLWNVQEIEDWGTKIFFEEHPLNEHEYYLNQLKDFLDYSGLGSQIKGEYLR